MILNRMAHACAVFAMVSGLAGTASAANVVDTAASTGQFNTLLAAAKAAGLADALATKQNITVFAPTDAAFAKLPKGTVEALLRPENKAKLQALLLYHVLPTKVASTAVPVKATAVATLDGSAKVTVRRHGSDVRVDKARVVKADIAADNGTIHVIDRVLIPN
jgi:uncharacterized surface protein with fasciclin (FAS1) repeats